MRVTRRSLCRTAALAGLGVVAGALPRSWSRAEAQTAAPGATPGTGFSSAETISLLRELILQRALGSPDPWVQAHVVLALGADVESGGKPVVDELVGQSLRLEAVGLKRYPHFPLDIERHPFHFLQILQATDVPYDRTFVTPLGRFTRREIVSGSEALYEPDAIQDELSWVVCVLCREFPQDHDTFTTARGVEVHVEQVLDKHLKDTEAAYAETFAAMAGARPYARGAIQKTACNGTHMLYGLIDALRYGYTASDLRRRTERLTGALLYRMRAEPALIDASLRAGHPLIRLNADAAKLTFLGHSVEDLGYAMQNGVFQLKEAQLQVVTEARRQLAAIVERLTGEYDLDELKAEVPQAYKIFLGDICHAYRGLRFWS